MANQKAYAENYQLIDWSDFRPSIPAKVEQPKGNATYFMPDLAEFTSPINYERITSRSQLREHERRHGVRQVGSDLKPHEFSANKPTTVNERALERAYREALGKRGLL